MRESGGNVAADGFVKAVDDSSDDQWPIYVPPVTMEPRTNPDMHILLWQARGTSELLVEDKALLLEPGHVLWIPAGTHRSVTVAANSVVLPFGFGVASTATTLIRPTHVAVDRGLRTILLALLQSRISVLKTEVNLKRQVLAIIEQNTVLSTMPMPSTPTAREVAEMLRFNPGDERSLGEHAEAVHTSYKTIERAFISETGLTFRQWRIRNRLEAAAALLRSNAVQSAVAHRVGYRNLSAFSRAFKEHFDMTPTEYIRHYRVQA